MPETGGFLHKPLPPPRPRAPLVGFEDPRGSSQIKLAPKGQHSTATSLVLFPRLVKEHPPRLAFFSNKMGNSFLKKEKKSCLKERLVKGKACQKLNTRAPPEKKHSPLKKSAHSRSLAKTSKASELVEAFFSTEEATSVGPALSPALEKRRQFMAQGTTLK